MVVVAKRQCDEDSVDCEGFVTRTMDGRLGGREAHPGRTISPSPSSVEPVPVAKSRGNVILIGASKDFATVTMTSAPKTTRDPKTHLAS